MAEQRNENTTNNAPETAKAEPRLSQEQSRGSKRRVFYIAPQKRGQSLKILIVSAFTLVLFMVVINSYVELNEVYSEISTASTTLSELRSENVRMQTELEGQASIRNIKEYAEERLGLKKMDQSQIQYIQIQTEDEVIVEEPEKNIFIKIKSWFNDLIEYLRG